MQSKLRCTASFSDQSPHGFHLVGGFHPLSPRLGRFARSGQPERVAAALAGFGEDSVGASGFSSPIIVGSNSDTVG